MEHHKRTLAKTISWRILAFFISTVILYLFSHDAKKSVVIIGSADFLKVFIYYAHERVWNKIKFGRIKPIDYQI